MHSYLSVPPWYHWIRTKSPDIPPLAATV